MGLIDEGVPYHILINEDLDLAGCVPARRCHQHFMANYYEHV